ncbi:hypothetical protein [Streptomyces sp. I05A-00742]|uniref:hypothetical protein n=1 Tax=Streptomyces sp. I05A-00742 TaxID=2732853 RepID=UPI001487EFB5|nr:hypothetical protein [Streptomyces sp. I05A-00742]
MTSTERNSTRKSTRARVAAALAASVLSLGVVGLAAPSASAASGCQVDPADGLVYCNIFDIPPVAKPALDIAIGMTCLNKETKDFLICEADQQKPAGTASAPGRAASQ